MSRVAMSISGTAARSASSRATLPALWPWRTIHSESGHFCSGMGAKASGVDSSALAPGGRLVIRRLGRRLACPRLRRIGDLRDGGRALAGAVACLAPAPFGTDALL